jgi:hypothetical protein
VNVRLRHLLLFAVPLVVIAGCGGGGGKTYDADTSRACMVERHFAVTDPPPDDLVAGAAEGGAYSVIYPGQKVTVSFGNDRKGAERIVRAYQRFGSKNISLEDALKVRNNAVILFGAHPTDDDVSKIEACLK